MFDFIGYLASIDPTQEYRITPLTGGLINLTIRATKIPSSDRTTGGRFQSHAAIILKYAPPFVAAIGSEAPFSTYRQIIEARALKLLQTNLEIQSAQQATGVSVPRLLHEDHVSHILILEDLGDDIIDVDKWLAGNPNVNVQHVGERLGRFLAAVHHLDTPFEEFVNPGVAEMLRDEVVGKMEEKLALFNVPDAEATVLCETIKSDFEEGTQNKGNGDGLFSVGDLWTGSILISPKAGKICLIDFEFAGEGRPLQDMAQLAAHLHLQVLGDSTGQVLLFSSALHQSYLRTSRAYSAPWLSPSRLQSTIRSAWILHGRELINNAVDRDFHTIGAETEEKAKEKQRQMVEIGMWYVRTAINLGSSDMSQEVFLRSLYTEEVGVCST